MSALFTPFTLKDVTLRNRVAVPPMCQYSARDGFVSEWHQAHYTALARGGAGLVIVEATGVLPEGRITPACLGLWDDAQAEGLARIAAAIKAAGGGSRHPDRPCRAQGQRQPPLGGRRPYFGGRSALLANHFALRFGLWRRLAARPPRNDA
jgi:hypothetical protein